MIWWMLYEPGGGYPFANGLVTDDSMPATKPAFDAYQTIVAELSTAHFERTLSLTETGSSAMEAYKFNDNVNRLEIYVAWIDPVDTNVTEFLSLAASQAIVLDIYGNSTAVSDGDDGQFDGHVTVQVGGQPVYVEISK